MEFSDYIIYADESGDHGLLSIDLNNPVFVLAFCIFRKEEYINQVVPSLQRIKFQFFGHDMIVLHSHDIRKKTGDFKLLNNIVVGNSFSGALNQFVEEAPFTLIASTIDKNQLKQHYAKPLNPYSIALKFCLERAYRFLERRGQHERKTFLVVEGRGRKEDNDLELEFRRICQGANWQRCYLPFEVVFARKPTNSTGLQLADLVAHPIGRHIVKPTQDNRAFDVVRKKFDHNGKGVINGWGLKSFP